MLPLKYARNRIRSVLKEIARLKDSDFPYSHSEDALEQFERLFQDRLTALDSLTDRNDPEMIRTACSESLLQVWKYLPLLGFVLRSTNVRNSFEIFGPLLRLARQVLGPDTKLILSSEWVYSPHVYNPIQDLPNYVLLGLPACESGNPLLVPLAGHELGHPTWRLKKLADAFAPTLSDKINERLKAQEKKYKDLFASDLQDLFMAQNLAPAHFWALHQSQESFCDFLGLRIFAESYLFAFAYLTTPGGRQRSGLYPRMKDRVAHLLRASKEFGVQPPEGYADWFTDETDSVSNEKESFLLEIADSARGSIVDDLITTASEIADSSGVPERSNAKIDDVLTAFSLLTPAATVGDLVNILNAAWKVFHGEDLWKGRIEDKTYTLNELVLKSIEILEFEERTRSTE